MISNTYFLAFSLKRTKTDSNTAKSRRPSDLFKMNSVFLCVEPDFSSLAVKDLRPDQHWLPIANGTPISLGLITRSFRATMSHHLHLEKSSDCLKTTAITAIRASSTSRRTTSTTTQKERLMHSQLVEDNSKEQLGPTGCETHTSTTHRACFIANNF